MTYRVKISTYTADGWSAPRWRKATRDEAATLDAVMAREGLALPDAAGRLCQSGGPFRGQVDYLDAKKGADEMTEHPIHAEARAFMDKRPDLQPFSLDEWLLEHAEKLTMQERRDGAEILQRAFDANE